MSNYPNSKATTSFPQRQHLIFSYFIFQKQYVIFSTGIQEIFTIPPIMWWHLFGYNGIPSTVNIREIPSILNKIFQRKWLLSLNCIFTACTLTNNPHQYKIAFSLKQNLPYLDKFRSYLLDLSRRISCFTTYDGILLGFSTPSCWSKCFQLSWYSG